MEKLKTLKDLYPYEQSDYGIEEDAILISDLKQEAIKWVKKNFNEDYSDNDLNYVDWMEFFNLTEEDLK